jgi:type 1 glutamine amidotransferase
VFTPIHAEIQSDIAAIKKTVEEAYVKGIHIERDPEIIRKGFHPDFNMLILKEDRITKWSTEKWIEVIEEQKKKETVPLKVKIDHRFTFVNVEGNAAIARIEILREGKHIYTDYFSLYRFSDSWKIVAKVYHRHPDSQGKTVQAETDRLRVLLVTGGSPLKYNRILVPSNLYSVFEENDKIVWDHASTDEAAFENDIRNDYDVVVFFNRSDSLSTSAAKHLEDFVESGNGIIILHSALSSYNDWEWWWREVVGGKYQYIDSKITPKSGYSQNEDIDFRPERDHRMTKAAGEFLMKDEIYNRLSIQPDTKILYRTSNPISDGPVVWIGPHSKSRVIVIQPGHGANAYYNPNFRTLITQAILWAGEGHKID